MTLDIQELIAEGTKEGSVPELGGLTTEQSTGVLANLAKHIDQAADITSDKGLGQYGISLAGLQTLGIVKKGISTTGDLEAVLADQSVFTGKNNVANVNDILGKVGKQRTLVTDVITKNLLVLTREGVITDETTEKEMAAFASLASQYTTEEIKTWNTGEALEALIKEIDVLASGGQYAVNLVDTKGADVLAKVQGIAGGAISAPELETGTVKTADIDAEVDKLIGSKRIPSAISPIELAAEDEISKATGKLNPEDLI